MVYINEWLPNPAGNDVGAEWVEIFNGGPATAPLQDWVLKTKSGKKLILKNYSLKANEYLLLRRPETGLVLRNTDEALFLYDSAGRLIDEFGFSGSAPEGKSFARQNFSDGGFRENNFIFTEPTPGQPNAIVRDQNFLMNNEYPLGKPLNDSLGYAGVLALTVCSAFLFAFFITVLLKRNDYLSKLFFSRD